MVIQSGFNTMENVSEVIKIVIADDHAIFRAGIIKVLNLDSQFEIIGEATNGLDAISLINNLSPDVAVLDIKMPGKTGIEIVRELNEISSPTKCLVLTNYDDPEYILDAIGEGANGYVLKTIEPSNLIDSVKGVAEGEIVLDPAIATLVAKLWRQRQSNNNDIVGIKSLTDREKETLELACNGLRNKDISVEMGISVRTVEGHFNRIFSKLGVSSRTEAVLQAVSENV